MVGFQNIILMDGFNGIVIFIQVKDVKTINDRLKDGKNQQAKKEDLE